MQHFFISSEQVADGHVTIVGDDVRHIVSALRMKPGEAFFADDGKGKEYYCIIERVSEKEVVAQVAYVRAADQELPCFITLYQGLPKADKMDLIIQKTVELGVSRIVPVKMKRCVVKLDKKKAENRCIRWNEVSEAAAKQSGRGIIPEVSELMDFKDALEDAKDADIRLIPYEQEGENSTMADTRRKLESVQRGQSIGVFIGPEGGFDPEEVELAREKGYLPITLGKRILRTETAGMYVMSVLGYLLEE